MFLVPRDKIPRLWGRSAGPAGLLRKNFVVAGTRALESDDVDWLCAAGCGHG